jgi:hypothetical protein
MRRGVGERGSEERRWAAKVYMAVISLGISASQDAETHHEGNDPEGAELTQGREQGWMAVPDLVKFSAVV